MPILKTVDEKIADNVAKRNGQAPAKDSVNSVKRLPKAFTDWVKDNKDRIAAAKSQPYFIRDNAKAVERIIPGVLPESLRLATPAPVPVLSIAERAKIRHDARTAEQAEAIRNAWNERVNKAFIPQKISIIENTYDKVGVIDEKDYTEGLAAQFDHIGVMGKLRQLLGTFGVSEFKKTDLTVFDKNSFRIKFYADGFELVRSFYKHSNGSIEVQA